MGWLFITEGCIKSLAVNNVITAVQGLASPTAAGCHLSFLSLFSSRFSLHHSFCPHTMSAVQFCTCYVIIPPQMLQGENARGFIPQKQKPTSAPLTPPSPSLTVRLEGGCTAGGWGKPRHHFKSFTKTQHQQLHGKENQGRERTWSFSPHTDQRQQTHQVQTSCDVDSFSSCVEE